MENRSLPVIALWRGVFALVYLNLVNAVPVLAKSYWPKAMEDIPHLVLGLQVGSALLSFAGGLFIAFGVDWLEGSFWTSGEPFLEGLQRRAWALLPFVLVGGVGGSFLVKNPVAPWSAIPSAIFSYALDSFASTLALMVLVAMLWKRIGFRKTSLCIVGLVLIFPVLRVLQHLYFGLRYSYWATTFSGPLSAQIAGMVSQAVLIFALVKMMKNTAWSAVLVWSYTFLFIFLGAIFSIYFTSSGPLLLQLTALVAAGALFWIERSIEMKAERV